MKTPSPEVSSAPEHSRRNFLLTAGSLAATAGAVSQAAGAAEAKTLPQVKFGKYSVSRLICGTNPFNPVTHISPMLDYEFRQYYTMDQIVKTLLRCQAEGINTVHALTAPRYQAFVKAGGTMQVFQNGSGDPARIPAMIENGAIGIQHYGVQTDTLYRQGKLSQAREYLKHVRDAGVLVGFATHIPDVFDIVESAGWDVDYYMLCLYHWGRTPEDLEQLFGDKKDLLPVETYSYIVGDGWSEVFLNGDPPKMFKRIQQTRKPCLAYKILAAGRKCQTPGAVEDAFKDAFANIKPTDAIIVGMYDRYVDQVAANCGYVRKYGAVSA
ncbi:MAG TPA: hypothetical protein VMU19_05860 [Bryobacteraceae bacterium]|nr:hypothetical protein [Bryobacteraceae bacterium]